MLRYKVRIRERWAGFFYKPLGTKLLTLNPTAIEPFPKRPLALSLGDEPTVDEMTGVIRTSLNWNAAAPDSLSTELLKLDHLEFTRCFYSILVNTWKTGCSPAMLLQHPCQCLEDGMLPSNGKVRPSRPFAKKGVVLITTATGKSHVLPMQARC